MTNSAPLGVAGGSSGSGGGAISGAGISHQQRPNGTGDMNYYDRLGSGAGGMMASGDINAMMVGSSSGGGLPNKRISNLDTLDSNGKSMLILNHHTGAVSLRNSSFFETHQS